MPTKNEVVAKQLDEIHRDLHKLWVALRTDPKKQAWKERMWSLLTAGLAAAATMGARQAATKLWMRATGDIPPPVHDAEEEAAKLRKKPS
jgi:hypothetical protein